MKVDIELNIAIAFCPRRLPHLHQNLHHIETTTSPPNPT